MDNRHDGDLPDLQVKEQALGRTALVNGKPARYRPPDSLRAFLEAL